jgi:cytochrome oxidase Cu insertion factor (SCO1/SenC/PrrC family)
VSGDEPIGGDNPRVDAQRAHGRRRLLIVAAVFFGPFVAAALMHAFGWQPGGYVNRGELLSPPLPLPPFEATMLGVRAPAPQAGRWTVLIVSDDGCSDACARALDDTRRVLDLLGHDRDRMQRVLVALTRLDADAIANQPDLIGLDTSKTTNPELRAPFAAATAGTVLVADPRRNVILRYKPGQDAKDLLEDLKRLLKYAG